MTTLQSISQDTQNLTKLKANVSREVMLHINQQLFDNNHISEEFYRKAKDYLIRNQLIT